VVLFAVVYPEADAVILHTPTAVVVTVLPVTVHGPIAGAVKLTVCPEGKVDALTENELPYWTFCNCAKLIVCDCVVEPAGSIVNDSDTEFAAS
jgi:hypothetical protein